MSVTDVCHPGRTSNWPGLAGGRERRNNACVMPWENAGQREADRMLAKLYTISLLGIEAVPVEVEVDVSPAATLV